MTQLFGPTQTLLLAALLLVIVASLPALPALVGRVARLPVFVYLGALLAGVALFSLAIQHSRVLPNQFPYKVVKYAVGELRQATETNVILIDGGSYVLGAVDTELLEEELQQLGYSVRAVRLATGAANHFERYRMQEATLLRLKKAPEPGQHWVYMAEVQWVYDLLPLAQLDKNQDTARAYHYLTPENGWYAAAALRSPGVIEPLDGEWRWLLLRHTLINAFNAGTLQRVAPEDLIEPGTGRVTNRRTISRGTFRGLGKVLEAAAQPLPEPEIIPGWLFDVRERRSRRLWQEYLDEFVYFGVPSTQPEQVRYVRGFCQSTRVKCIAPSDPELLQALDDRAAWRNVGHMNRTGARVYSPWLARALASSGALKK